MKTILLPIFYLLLTLNLYSQSYYDIKNPGNDYRKKCEECLKLISSKPQEIQYGIQHDDANNLFFVITSKEWFDKLIAKNSDGIAIDIVGKSRYDCSKGKLNINSIVRGDLQRPMYLKELKKHMVLSENGQITINMGTIPTQYINKDVEFNIVFIKDRYLCHYNSFCDLKTYRWDLLDMGLYFDTLTYKSQFDTSLTAQEKYILQHKILKFEIPFKKNKAEYSAEDIKPLYDSLKLTDFTIQKITIRSYSSIEGSEDRNMKLQKERSESIAAALQTFQTPSITTEIFASENWVDFLNDITYTPFTYLAELSKADIKEKLKDKKLEQDLEPYFKSQRKAIIILELQKKNKYEQIPVTELVSMFSKSISEKNLEQAIEIQNSIFDKVRNHESSTTLIDKLNIPAKSEFSLLLNKNSIFKYMMNDVDVYETFKELTDLQDLIPNDGHIKYNVCALKFKVWLLGNTAINPLEFRKEINNLTKYGISQNLVKRMLINYEILMCEHYMAKRDFANKDKSLRYMFANYQNLPLTDGDYLSLAQYFSSYSKYDWAIKLLEKRVKSIDIDEDLLFYYLNLTLIDEKLTKRTDYRTTMLNAINLNKTRYCKLFDPFGQGGITFQLLENDYLRKTYCESCQ